MFLVSMVPTSILILSIVFRYFSRHIFFKYFNEHFVYREGTLQIQSIIIPNTDFHILLINCSIDHYF